MTKFQKMEIVANDIIAPILPLGVTKLGPNSRFPQKLTTLHITSCLGSKHNVSLSVDEETILLLVLI